jgi:DNA polymerase-3 subunit delta'
MLFKKYAEKFPVVVESLKKARANGRLAHAYLLHGDTPKIRKEFAAVLGQLVICPNLDEAGNPCGECKTCRQLESGTYPELYTLMPVGKMWQIPVGDRKNPEPNTLRWFEEQFYLTSTAAASRKIGVIFDCDRMNTESQNAFLKTLEEPPKDCMFILATGNPSALLPTTRSRCQTLLLLENNCVFDFENSDKLFAALARLQFEATGNLTLAEQSAAEIISITKNLKDSAENRIEGEWQSKLEQSKELEPAVRKRIERQYDAAVAGEYIRERNYFTGAIHTWFAQTYQLSCGALMDKLANPEIFEGLNIPANPDEKQAYRALSAVEKLLYDLRFNVNEELALRSFCLKVAVGE